MLRTLTSALAFASTIALALPLATHAADYPERPVHVLVGYAAGSGPDIQARLISHALSESLHQSFVVENRTGANGTIAARGVATGAPDGYTLLFSSSSITPTPHIYKSLGFDMLTDLKPVATSGELDGLFMLVDSKSPLKTLPEFIANAKKNRVLYGSPGVGNELHLVAELFSQKAGIKMDHIPYKGASEVMNGLLSGAVNVMFVTPPSVMGLLRDGRVRALAFTGTKPFPEFPNVPLMQDTLPGFTNGSWGMFFAPSKTPDAIVTKLNLAVRDALKQPSVANKMQRDGYMPDNRDPAAVQVFFRKAVQEAGVAVKAAGIEPN
jgi:tripartite-type tricarboxylate transporter receptor subunit TctC